MKRGIPLTEREKQVADLLASGVFSNIEFCVWYWYCGYYHGCWNWDCT